MQALVFALSPARWLLARTAGVVTRRALYRAVSPLRLVTQSVPDLPGPQWIRLRTILGGVCGTDLALIALRQHPATILQQFASFPCVLGHENVAVIDAVGAEAGDWRPGQRVCVEPAFGCEGRGIVPPCPSCEAGRPSLCEASGDDRLPPRAMVGLNRFSGGSWAEFFLAHRTQLHAVPDGLPDEHAVLTDPLASALHAVLRRRPTAREQVLVNGSGIIAQGVIAGLRALGHGNSVTAVVRHDFQAETARRLGASDVVTRRRHHSAAQRYDAIAARCGGRRLSARFGNQAMIGGFDLVYDCTGTGRGLTDALKWTGARGTVVAAGTSGITLLDTTPLWFDEITLVGSNGRQIETLDDRRAHTYDLVLSLLSERRIDAALLPVTRFRLADYRSAFAALFSPGRGGILKAAFDPR